jgi:hypothetical protein
MFDTDDQADYRQRADMHERLAEATNDPPARKMHQAMAAEYRRRALASAPAPSDRMLELDVAAH